MTIIENNYAAGNRAFSRRDWQGASEGFSRVYAVNSKDDVAVYLAAATWVRAEKPEAAFEWLQRLWQIGELPRAEREILRGDRETTRASRTRTPSFAPRPRSSIARSWRSRCRRRTSCPRASRTTPSRRSSTSRASGNGRSSGSKPGAPGRARRDRGLRARRARTGSTPSSDMKVDAVRRRLWAVSAAEPEMKGFTPETLRALGASRVRPRLENAREEDRPPGPLTHLFNDLALDAAGNVYVTDTESAEVLVLRGRRRRARRRSSRRARSSRRTASR